MGTGLSNFELMNSISLYENATVSLLNFGGGFFETSVFPDGNFHVCVIHKNYPS